MNKRFAKLYTQQQPGQQAWAYLGCVHRRGDS